MTSNRRIRLPHRVDAASAAQRLLPQLAGGRLSPLPVAIRFWDGSTLPRAQGSNGGPPVTVVAGRRAISHLLHRPDQLGLARGWVDGSLTVDGDLEQVLAVRTRFHDVSFSLGDRLRVGLAALRLAGPGVLRQPPIPSIEASVSGRRHSVTRDRQAVRHHYDVSNEFYRLVLGPTMVYSCAYYADRDDTLDDAQTRKLDVICRKLRLSPGERLLDVGCGWGSLLIHAAANYGVHAVGVTLSEEQARLGRERLREQGLEDRVEIRVSDYREVTDGPFDKIASVGMYEHVGRSELDAYVRTVHGLLRPGGLFLNHGIARLYSEQPGPDTYISRYIFPDGELHPVTDVMTSMQSAGLEVRDAESLRDHYPLTLRRWLANLQAHREEAIAIVGPERERAWELYLLASALGFEDGDITVYQVLTTRPDAASGLPLDRTELLLGTAREPSATAAAQPITQ